MYEPLAACIPAYMLQSLRLETLHLYRPGQTPLCSLSPRSGMLRISQSHDKWTSLRSATRLCRLDEVDEETFLRFLRWTYSGDYPAREHSVLKPEEKEDEKAEDPPAVIVDQLQWPTTYETDNFDAWGEQYSSYKIDKKKKKKTPELTLREAFGSQRRDTRCLSRPSIPRARANTGPKEDYTDIFLGHARMYVFADKFDIQPFKQLALQKLHHQLAIHTLYIERVGEITTLLKYVYTNTMAPITSIHEEDGIRAMLAHSVGMEMAMLAKDDVGIRDLMLEDPDMLGDFLKTFALKIT